MNVVKKRQPDEYIVNILINILSPAIVKTDSDLWLLSPAILGTNWCPYIWKYIFRRRSWNQLFAALSQNSTRSSGLWVIPLAESHIVADFSEVRVQKRRGQILYSGELGHLTHLFSSKGMCYWRAQWWNWNFLLLIITQYFCNYIPNVHIIFLIQFIVFFYREFNASLFPAGFTAEITFCGTVKDDPILCSRFSKWILKFVLKLDFT